MVNTSLISSGLLIVAIINIFLAYIIMSVRPRQAFHAWAALLALSCGFWTAGVSLFLASSQASWLTELIVKAYYASAATIAYALLHLTLTFPRLSRRHPMIDWLSAIAYVSVMALALLGDLIRGVNIPMNGGHIALLGNWQYVVYVIYFVTFSVIALVTLVQTIEEYSRSGQHRLVLQLKTMRWGIVVALGFGLVFNLLLPLLGNYNLIWAGPPFTLVFVGSVVYGIIRHGLFDIRLAIIRVGGYVLSLTTLGILYTVVVVLVLQESVLDHPLFIGLALIIAFVFQPLRLFFDRLSEQIFYRSTQNVDDLVSNLSHTLARTTDLRLLLMRAARIITTAFTSSNAFFFVTPSEGKYVSAGTPSHPRLSKELVSDISSYFSEHRERFLLVESLLQINEQKLKRQLLEHDIALILPLVDENGLLGCLLLGNKQTNLYTPKDLKVLQALQGELSIAIQNALSVHALRELNATLQQRIEAATRELRASNHELERLDAVKDEFISMASHQLRTPLTSVKGYISMVLEGDVGKISKGQRQLLSEAFTSSERMVHLIADFLNVSRLQTGKFLVDARPVDLAHITSQEVDSLQTTAKARTLKLHYRPPARFPILYLDEAKIRQVIMNFIDNAIYYSHEDGTITVTLETIEGFAELRVRDNGIGVPILEQNRLFGKFFRAANARRQRPDGTGVGLFLAKKVIDAHSGSIIFESVEGKGSTFGFRLPLALLRSSNSDNLHNDPNNSERH